MHTTPLISLGCFCNSETVLASEQMMFANQHGKGWHACMQECVIWLGFPPLFFYTQRHTLLAHTWVRAHTPLKNGLVVNLEIKMKLLTEHLHLISFWSQGGYCLTNIHICKQKEKAGSRMKVHPCASGWAIDSSRRRFVLKKSYPDPAN